LSLVRQLFECAALCFWNQERGENTSQHEKSENLKTTRNQYLEY
jgi:hypothetical protein